MTRRQGQTFPLEHQGVGRGTQKLYEHPQITDNRTLSEALRDNEKQREEQSR